MTELSPAQLAVLASGLTLDLPVARRPVAVSAHQCAELGQWAAVERLDGLLWNAVATGEIVVRPADDVEAGMEKWRKDIRDCHLAGLRSSLAAESTGAIAVATLQRKGITPLLFKGLANAHLDYPDPSWRTFFDADLLVPRSDFARSIEVLMAAGFTRATPPLRTRWERRFGRAAELRSPQGVELDLHASLSTGYFGGILDHDQLRADTVNVEIGGVRCAAFGASARLLISGYATVLSRGAGLRLYRDFAQQLLVTGADWAEAVQLAGEGDAVLAEAFTRLARVLGIVHEGAAWAEHVEASPTARRALEYAERAIDEGWSADARSAMLGMNATDRVRFLAGVALPSRSNLRARRRTIVGHLALPASRGRTDSAGRR